MKIKTMKYFITAPMELLNLKKVVVNTFFLRLKNIRVKTLLWISVWYLGNQRNMENDQGQLERIHGYFNLII